MSEPRGDDDAELAWLLAIERGEPPPPIDQATAGRHRRLAAMMRGLPAVPDGAVVPGTSEPIDDTLRAAIDAAAPPGLGRARRRLLVGTIAVVALAVIALAIFRRGRVEDRRLVIAVTTIPDPQLHRGAEPSVGDLLVVRAEVNGTAELRVYGGAGSEWARCTGAAGACTLGREGGLELRHRIAARGAVRVVVFAAPPNVVSMGLDADLEAARRAGIAWTSADPVDVH